MTFMIVKNALAHCGVKLVSEFAVINIEQFPKKLIRKSMKIKEGELETEVKILISRGEKHVRKLRALVGNRAMREWSKVLKRERETKGGRRGGFRKMKTIFVNHGENF